ncbi:uncharacterized protein LOC133885822 isoform X2 [Phragmites australis]|uniref:uncharacterized protein LOC133885822 isoform X2 n=1 Tax=Phragmites australis TaxID=29695 RepID=UPI002D7889B1|nr:uncharacterized protein LOC133885822 isoform X2 [Phragmites australis]
MAAAGAPFSIREYAARARARAGTEGGSWPFGGEEGALPPMEVQRFRWWADEALAVEEEEREVERRMAAKRRKRSVAELFAAVPRVAGGQRDWGRRRLQAKQREKGKLVLGVGVKASKGFEQKKVATGIDETSHGVKAASISISQLFQDSIIKRKLKKSLSKKKRIQGVSLLLDKKSKKGNKRSVLDSQKKAITNSVQAQSILKKQSKAGFSTLLNNTDVRCKFNPSCKPKHVTFSDDGWTAPLPEDNTEQPQLVQTSQQPSHECHDHHNTDEPQLVYQQADAISVAVDEDTSSLSEIVVPTGVCRTVPLAKPKDRTILGNSVDLNHRIGISNRSNCLNSIGLACLSNKVPTQNFDGVDSHLADNECLNLDVECLVEENQMIPQRSSNLVSLAVKAISGDINRSPLSQPSSSCLNDRSRSMLQGRLVANCHFDKVRAKLLRTCNGVVNSISSSTGSNKSADAQAADCVSACRNTYFSDNYVGLPLNSRGEFIKVHPGGTPNSIDIFKRQCLGENSSCPSALPTFFTPRTCTDHVNLRTNHHVPQIYTADQFVFHPDPHYAPTAPTAYGMDFRQLSSSERMKTHNYPILSNRYPCNNQQEFSVEYFCTGCMGHHNPQQKLLGMQSCYLSLNCEQNTQPTDETTMRLMGKTVTLGTSGIQCRGLNNETPCSSKQSLAEDHSFQGACTKAFPRLFQGGLVDPSSAFRISDSERQPSEKPSYFSFVPAAELRSGLDTDSFRTSGHNQQPELAAPNNLYVQPVSCCNKGGLGHQQPFMANQVQSSAEDMLFGSMHCRQSQSAAAVSSFNRMNSARNFVEKSPAPYHSSCLTQQLSNMTQRTPISSFPSGYAVQSTPGLTTQTKFTSLPPLPPSVISSHCRSADYAQPHGSSPTFFPSIPLPYPMNKSNAPGDAIFKDESMKWSSIGSKLEGFKHMKRSCKRPAEKDDVFLTLPKKHCIAVQKDLSLFPIPEKGLEFCGPGPNARLLDMPVGFGSEPEADLRLGNKDAHSTWSDPVNMVRPVKLKSGARHVLQPSASSMGQENSGPVHSVTRFAAENDACTVCTSKTRDTEIYKF